MPHGSEDGFNDLVAAAKASPTPLPADLKIVDAVSIEKQKFANEEEWTKAHPEEALWKTLKAALTGADGGNYFSTSMKDSQVPTLKAKVVSLEPASKPKTILVAVEDGTNNTETADATLKFEAALPGKVEPGTELTFEGVPQSYTASPLMVRLSMSIKTSCTDGRERMRRPRRCITNLERRRPRASNGIHRFWGLLGPGQYEASSDTLPEVQGSVRVLDRRIISQEALNSRGGRGVEHANQHDRPQQQPRT